MLTAIIGVGAVVIGAVLAFIFDSLRDRRGRRDDKEGALLGLIDTLDWAEGEIRHALETGDWTRLTAFRGFRQHWLRWLRDVSDLDIDDLLLIESTARYFKIPPDFVRITQQGATQSERAQLRRVHSDIRKVLRVLWADVD